MASNWIPDLNRFKLAGPPTWWLSHLAEFDPSLVVVPSRQGFYYRLAQRRKLRLPDRIVNDVLFKESDTRMLASYSLVPVTTILATANWDNPYLFVELANRAPWRMGGADKVNQMLENQDRQDRSDRQKQVSEHLDFLSRDAWNMYNKQMGLRTHAWDARPKAPSSISITAPCRMAKVYPSQFMRDR